MQSQGDLAQALQLIEAQDDSLISRLQEILSTHPMIVRRIQALRSYAVSSQYKRLQARVNQNPVFQMTQHSSSPHIRYRMYRQA